MTNNRGVSLIELVLVIIIILIIATFSVFSGRESLDQATAVEIYTEINAIREAINSVNVKKELDESFSIEGEELYDIKLSNFISSEEEFETTYKINIPSGDYNDIYIIYGMDEPEKYNASNVRKSYGLDNIKHTYIVNFDKAEVNLLQSVIIGKRKVRTFEEIRSLVDNGNI